MARGRSLALATTREKAKRHLYLEHSKHQLLRPLATGHVNHVSLKFAHKYRHGLQRFSRLDFDIYLDFAHVVGINNRDSFVVLAAG